MGRDPTRHGYRKGDNKAGGGGSGGGGGKRGRAPHGWEKGDNLRDFSRVREDVEFPRKPGSPHYPPPTFTSVTETRGPVGPTIFAVLRSTNAKLLTTLRKLEGVGINDAERRADLVEVAVEHLQIKRQAEEDLFPLLLDHPEVREGVLGARDMGDAIDEQLMRLLGTDPHDRDFTLVVRSLHGTLEQQIVQEDHAILPDAERVIPRDQAIDLAAQLRP